MWKEGKALDLMDQTIRETCNADEFLRCVNIGLLCVQEDPSDRPTMSNVVFMLSSEIATLPTPKQPAYVVRRSIPSATSSTTKPESSNELTVPLKKADNGGSHKGSHDSCFIFISLAEASSILTMVLIGTITAYFLSVILILFLYCP